MPSRVQNKTRALSSKIPPINWLNDQRAMTNDKSAKVIFESLSLPLSQTKTPKAAEASEVKKSESQNNPMKIDCTTVFP